MLVDVHGFNVCAACGHTLASTTVDSASMCNIPLTVAKMVANLNASLISISQLRPTHF